MQEFVSLLTNHQEVIRAYIITQIPGCSEVRDILQEVNLLMWEKMGEFKIGSNFGAWACTIAYYKVLNYRKKEKKNGFLIFSDDLANILSTESETREPLTLEAKRNALQHCLEKLNPKERQLLDSRYNNTSSNMKEVSAATGRSRASLRVSLSRLRAGLKNCINKRIIMKGGAA